VLRDVVLEVERQLDGEGFFSHAPQEVSHSGPELHVHRADSRREWRAMTVFDIRCDRCGKELATPADAIRFLYHPGDMVMKDDSGLLCRSCWRAALGWLGVEQPVNVCARCTVR
jgi:hypothetical protein